MATPALPPEAIRRAVLDMHALHNAMVHMVFTQPYGVHGFGDQSLSITADDTRTVLTIETEYMALDGDKYIISKELEINWTIRRKDLDWNRNA